MKNKRDKKIVEAVTAIGDSVRFSTATGEYRVKRGFYYQHGSSKDKMAAAIKAAVPGAQITYYQEHDGRAG